MNRANAFRMTMLRLLLAAACLCAACRPTPPPVPMAQPDALANQPSAQSATPAEDDPAVLSSDEQTEIGILTRQLADAQQSQATKLDAATLLLSRRYPQAAEALHTFLNDASNRDARIAIAQAIAIEGVAQPAYVDDLFAMLADADEAVRQAAAAALTTLSDRALLDRLLLMAAAGDSSARLGAIAALAAKADRRSVETLIALLDDADPAIPPAAAAGLARLTGLRTFGPDAARWGEWWRANRGKNQQEWLDDLLNAQVRKNEALETEAAALRARLSSSLQALCNATTPADRPALLLGLLKDPLTDVQLTAIDLTGRCLSAGLTMPPEAADLLPGLLGSSSERVRLAAAKLAPLLNDDQTPQLFMERLAAEQAPAVREALVGGLGVLRVREAVGPLLNALATDGDLVAATAALGIARIAEKAPLEPADAHRAAALLEERYSRCPATSVALREALLGAISSLGRNDLKDVLRLALADPTPSIRLAGVRGLETLKDSNAAAEIGDLVSDSDRSVRQAALSALAGLGDESVLDAVLSRTQSESEPDPTVRQRAWETAMALLAKAPLERLTTTAAALADRADARDYRIRLLTLQVDRLKDAPGQQTPIRLQLAEALRAANRPTEAATEYSAALKVAGDGPAWAGEIWLKWIDALLAADDLSALGAMGSQQDDALFAGATSQLFQRVTMLRTAGRHETIILLAGQARTQLGDRLSTEQAQDLATILEQARANQAEADRQRVSQLLVRMAEQEPDRQKAAADELLAMRNRAVLPLLEHLKAVVSVDMATTAASTAPASTALEALIIEMLPKLAPNCTNYDAQASQVEKLRVVESWMASLAGPGK